MSSTTSNTTAEIKRPTFTLSLPDPELLRRTIAAIEAEPQKLVALEQERQRLQGLIDKFTSRDEVVPDDDPDLQHLPGWHARLKILPAVEEKLQRKIEELNDTLFPQLAPFAAAILAEAQREYRAWMDIAADHIRPLVPRTRGGDGEVFNHIPFIVQKFPWRTLVPGIFEILTNKQKPTPSEREARFHNISPDDIPKRKAGHLEEDFARGRYLLDLHAQIKKAGRFFYTPDELHAADAKASAEEASAKAALPPEPPQKTKEEIFREGKAAYDRANPPSRTEPMGR